MRTTRLGCVSGSGILIAVVSLLVIAGISASRGGVLFNPGALNAQAGEQTFGGVNSHAETGGRCSACHTAVWEDEKMADRCLACHTELSDDPKEFHNVMLAQSQSWTCQDCHTEHGGAQASLTVMHLNRFPHDAAGFSLKGHRETPSGASFVCSDCHGGQVRTMDLAACLGCHQGIDNLFMDDHFTAFGNECLVCHDGLDTYGKAFNHDQGAFPLQGEHAQAMCSQCHLGARTIIDLQSAPQDCFSCHADDDAHLGRFGDDCAVCHTPDGWKGAAFDHSLADFQITGEHEGVACEACHLDGVFQGTPQNCYSCHAGNDPHLGQFGQDCAQCHTDEGWENATFDHSLSAFQLTGEHEGIACEACHLDGVFQGTPQDCYSCHADDDEHLGGFGPDCAQCHTAEGWENASFDHSLTAFQLTGAHSEVPCADCHADGIFEGTPGTCFACHSDPVYHLGLFGTDCASCHNTAAWIPATFDRPHTFPFNHGESGINACQQCHPDSLVTYTCYTCHEHSPAETEREHREEGISDFQDCTRCHPTGQEEEGGERGDDD